MALNGPVAIIVGIELSILSYFSLIIFMFLYDLIIDSTSLQKPNLSIDNELPDGTLFFIAIGNKVEPN